MVVNREGPVLVEGPVEVVGDDGTTTRSDRFVVAICTCRRSRAYPWCDTSHRRRKPAAGPAESRPDDGGRQPEENEEEPRP
ncbi:MULTISPECIES: CDGSH iron-sulfur domain-containing protein [Streptomyces]|uniref:CDGSH iron-sulfur domain-containing protein n=1 Tax=Streptomyces TaxID=1883 RepID=UPI0028AEA21D|nr:MULTISPECIES: CDGSH iron-sulfur domain-containing protein [Streptomyces]MDX2918438.1 CDGSH iron-sulfur domain-containing protein [Streptomyces sp. NE06-03C]MDX3605007.1 CDGSH iron-sulfur domain-containing protein [Streptomyces sp. FL06-04B]MDX3735778.1 CDGSH iron-sulfur domain-containing protein [Streptomyces sp. ID01-15D]